MELVRKLCDVSFVFSQKSRLWTVWTDIEKVITTVSTSDIVLWVQNGLTCSSFTESFRYSGRGGEKYSSKYDENKISDKIRLTFISSFVR